MVEMGSANEKSLPYGARASMEPAGFTVEMRAGEHDDRITMAVDSFSDVSCEAADVTCSFDGEVFEIALVARDDVFVESCRVELRHAFATEERVLLNGYQSRTDTAERSPWAKMRGLKGIAPAVVDRWALDSGGDYRYVEYKNKRGRQHGFTYASFRRGEGLVLVGSLDESHGFTLISTDAAHGVVVVETESPRRRIAPGERVCLTRCAIVRGVGGDVYDRWFELSGIRVRTARPLVGYTSWYKHYGDIDEKCLAEDLAGAATGFAHIEATGIRTADATKAFQIDDGYCKVGDWLDVDERKFPNGLAPLAYAARAMGFVPGLWAAPFVCERDSRTFLEHDEWLLRDELGEPVMTGPQWSDGYALDTRNPEVRSYVLDVLQTMTRDWGFSLLKLDFLYAACLVEHDGMNRGELMADAIDLLRRGMGDDCLFLACGVPLGSVFGKADYCRIGCDVGLDWDDKVHMRVLHRERVSTKNSLTNTYARSPLDGRAFGNDPDVFFMRDDVKMNQGQLDELLFAAADLGSVLMTSDNMGKWSDQAMTRYEAALKLFLDGRRNG